MLLIHAKITALNKKREIIKSMIKQVKNNVDRLNSTKLWPYNLKSF